MSGVIAGLAGDDRDIVGYLVEEVLQRQPERVRSFLLHTSVLGRPDGALCDAVTGRGGKAMLGTDLDGPDIARELVVSLNTVCTHTGNAHAELGVDDRRAAVRRGGEPDLVSRRPAVHQR